MIQEILQLQGMQKESVIKHVTGDERAGLGVTAGQLTECSVSIRICVDMKFYGFYDVRHCARLLSTV